MYWNGMATRILYISKWKRSAAQSEGHIPSWCERGAIDMFVSLEVFTRN